MKTKLLALSLALWSSGAFCAPHLEPCDRLDDYEERVERLLRDAWPVETQVLDFSRTRVRVSKLSVPITDQLARALLDVFRRSAEAAKPEEKSPTEEILSDGYQFEVLLAEHPCVKLANPPPESEAGRLDRFVRLLDVELRSWKPYGAEEFERKVTEAIPR